MRPPKAGWLNYALAGLEAGIVGIIWMFACFVVAAFWDGSGIWSVPNLYSTVFYGDYAFDDAFLRTTWAGLALIVVFYGLIGVIWGCFWKENRKTLLSFLGALTGLIVYYLSFHFLWPRLNPLISLHAPVRELEVAHILWGAALARSPVYSRRMAVATRTSTVASVPDDGTATYASPPAADPDDAESVSGELIQ